MVKNELLSGLPLLARRRISRTITRSQTKSNRSKGRALTSPRITKMDQVFLLVAQEVPLLL